MHDNILPFMIVAFVIIACVIAYNIYQEQKFRNKIRSQFGGAQEDVLLNTNKNQVRDGEEELLRPVIIGEHAENATIHESHAHKEEDPLFHGALFADDATNEHEEIEEPVMAQENLNIAQQFVFEEVEEKIEQPTPEPTIEEDIPQGNWLMDLNNMAKLDLPWFDHRIDYLAYVSLASLQELSVVPRLSNRRRYQIAGCTAHNRFQVAEAIPGVQYQSFVLGLQSIDRNGLASEAELQQFKEQATSFASEINGGIKFTDMAEFFESAKPIDRLCEEVDKVIAIHLVSRSSILGTELRQALEDVGFELEHDGAFYFYDNTGCPLFTVVTLDGSVFTAPLLTRQAYRGFSMLFSVALVKDGEKTFNQFMDVAVQLSSKLHLDLVDDKRQELSTQWLKEIREYVVVEQKKMFDTGIVAGGELAQRLFS